MSLKSRYITLFALIILTATPRAFDQLTDLKNFAHERFRAELLNIFWSFTTPESRRGDARRYSELLARAEAASAPGCDDALEIKAARAHKNIKGIARWKTTTPNPEHQEFFAVDETSREWLLTDADAGLDESVEPFEPKDSSAVVKGADVLLVARNFQDYPLFDETSGAVRIEDAVAQFKLSREDELPVLSKREPVDAQRSAQRFVQTSFQIRLPENLDKILDEKLINSDALIKVEQILAPPKAKCRVRAPLPVAPEAPRPLEKPPMIS